MAKGWKENINTFDNADRVKLLGVIDHLRELGISDDIPLPQVRHHSSFSRPFVLTVGGYF